MKILLIYVLKIKKKNFVNKNNLNIKKFELLKPEFLNKNNNKNIKKNYLTLNIKEEKKNDFNNNLNSNKSLNFIIKNKNNFPSSQMLIYKDLSNLTNKNKEKVKSSKFISSYNSIKKGFSFDFTNNQTNYQTNLSLNNNFFLTNIQNKSNYLCPLKREKTIKKINFLFPNLSFNLFKKFDLNLKNNKFIGKAIKNFNVKNKENFISGNYNVPLITFLLKKK